MVEENVKWLWHLFLEFSITNRTFFTAQLLLAVSISSLFLLPQQPSLHEHSPRWDRLVLCALFNMLFFFYFFPCCLLNKGHSLPMEQVQLLHLKYLAVWAAC